VLDEATQKEIVRTTQAFWDDKCFDEAFVSRMRRKKEKGQGLANWVEEQTVDMLEGAYCERAAFQVEGDKGKTRRDRSMGDIWIESGGLFNPVNVKTGVKTPGKRSGSQPNLVSLPRMADALLKRWIDAYYLLFIYFVDSEPPIAQVTLADLFLIMEEYVSYNAGPQQLMLKARKFEPPPAPTYGGVEPADALAHLLDLRNKHVQKLIVKRTTDLAAMRTAVAHFDPTAPIDQTGARLDPAC